MLQIRWCWAGFSAVDWTLIGVWEVTPYPNTFHLATLPQYLVSGSWIGMAEANPNRLIADQGFSLARRDAIPIEDNVDEMIQLFNRDPTL